MSDEQNPQDTGGITMDFSTFILSLNASSLIHLGEIHDPQLKERSVNLPAAKHTIEILEILEAKTVGNLDDGESKLLKDILYNLRLKYVQHSKGSK